jgi:hypothetical protein
MTEKKSTPGTDEATRPPVIFLAGPPGAGKTTLGQQACDELELVFLDLSHPASSDGDAEAGRVELEGALARRSADVIALSWALQQDRGVLKLARRSGELLLLWDHPLEMRARSGRTEPLFTPVGRLKTRGGFGRKGIGCKEYRRLERACNDTLLLVGTSLDQAARWLTDTIAEIRAEVDLPPAQREGLDWWVDKWREDHDASPAAARILVDAMARFTLQLKCDGAPSRKMSGVYSDLDAAGMLVFMYDAPKGKSVLKHFYCPPWTFEFKRKFSDSPRQVARYERTLEAFAQFLEQSGMIPGDD